MHQLRDYQERGINAIARHLRDGKRRLIRQLMTGGGKTVEFSTICHRFTVKSGKRILILVHRVELMQQAYKTLYDWYAIPAQMITADTKSIHDRPVYIGMVETVYRRMQKNPNYLPPDVAMVIYDEAHRGEHKKMHQLFPNAYLLGYTATPISASRKDPIKNHFDDVVTGPTPQELIRIGALCQNRTYSIKGINRKKFHVKGNDFDTEEMAAEFGKSKHVQNCLSQYQKHGRGKAIIYNCNITHSKLVQEAFLNAGYDCRHVDGGTPDEERKQLFRWFAETTNAILCNVDIATTGTDIPSVETIVINRSTKSLVIWLQCTGRGSRPYPGKDHFTIIDMGGNAMEHGDWCDDRDWYDIFHNPEKPRQKKGAAPVKECPACDAIIPVQTMTCPFCQFEFPRKIEYDTNLIELELITTNLVVEDLIERNQDKKPYFTLFQIGNKIAAQAKHRGITNTEKLLSVYHEKTKEWCKASGKTFNQWHKEVTRDHLYKQLGVSLQQVPALT